MADLDTRSKNFLSHGHGLKGGNLTLFRHGHARKHQCPGV